MSLSNKDLAKLKIKAKLAAEAAKKKKEYVEDFELFAYDNVKILPKDPDPEEGYRRLVMNEAQRHIHGKLEEQRKKTGKVRAIVLKARQQGSSTYFAARTYWRTTNRPHTRAMMLAHDQPTSDALFSMTKSIHSYQPEANRPAVGTSNKKELIFTDLESSYKIHTAGSPQAGRGNTPTILNCSEVAFWNKAEDLISGLFQGVPATKDTEIILESTARGASGEFYRLYQEAKKGNGSFIAIFIPWFITSEYVLEVPEGFERTHIEDDLAAKYGLTDEQIMFRRDKISEGGEDKFMQEYPSNDEEAFLRTGSVVFDVSQLSGYEALQPAATEMYVGGDRKSFDLSNYGNLEVWKYPDFEGHFLIGCDVATGTGGDYSTAVVMNPHGEICALFRDNYMDPSLFGEMLFYLGRRYNNALLVVERNGPGIATLNRLDSLGYNNMYFMTKVNKASKETTTTLGFNTNVSTKPQLISGLAAAIREQNIDIPSNYILDELKNYIVLESGRMEAAKGFHDDTVIATALCIEGLRTHADQLSKKVSWKQIVGNDYGYQDTTKWM